MRIMSLTLPALLLLAAGAGYGFDRPSYAQAPSWSQRGARMAQAQDCPTPGQQKGARQGKQGGPQDGSGPQHEPGTGGGNGGGNRGGNRGGRR